MNSLIGRKYSNPETCTTNGPFSITKLGLAGPIPDMNPLGYDSSEQDKDAVKHYSGVCP